MSESSRPPLDVEQAMDVVLAAAAHRSTEERHREFGKMVLDRYFTQLREDYKDDPTAKGYLDNLTASMASAIRAFSVERDRFGRRIKALETEKQQQVEATNRILDYSPLKEKGVWGKAFSIIGGGGIAVALRTGFALEVHAAPWLLLAFAAAGAVIGLVACEVLINWYHDRQRDKIEEHFPNRVEYEWQTRSLRSYHKILRQFLVSAIKIREEYYPELPTLAGKRLFNLRGMPHLNFVGEGAASEEGISADLNLMLDAVVERHFALELDLSTLENAPRPRREKQINLPAPTASLSASEPQNPRI